MAIRFKQGVLKSTLVAAIALGSATLAVNGYATDATSNLAVSATVVATCTIATSAVSFGTYNPQSGSYLDGAGKVTTTCTVGSTPTITLGQGTYANTGSTATLPLRRMKEAGSNNYLSYQLYSDTGRSTVWGDTGVATTPTGAAQDTSVYGRISAQTETPIGSYSDTVVATVSF
jgi:spore coat protein U-like protein